MKITYSVDTWLADHYEKPDILTATEPLRIETILTRLCSIYCSRSTVFPNRIIHEESKDAIPPRAKTRRDNEAFVSMALFGIGLDQGRTLSTKA